MTKGAGIRTTFRAELVDLFRWRRDVRRFRREPLPEGTLERLIGLANLAPSVGLSQPWRFVIGKSPAIRDAVRACFEMCNAEALRSHTGDRASLYAQLKLAGLDEAPCQFAVFADRATHQGHGLGRGRCRRQSSIPPLWRSTPCGSRHGRKASVSDGCRF